MDGRNVNRFIHKYVIAAAHAILWLAALSRFAKKETYKYVSYKQTTQPTNH